MLSNNVSNYWWRVCFNLIYIIIKFRLGQVITLYWIAVFGGFFRKAVLGAAFLGVACPLSQRWLSQLPTIQSQCNVADCIAFAPQFITVDLAGNLHQTLWAVVYIRRMTVYRITFKTCDPSKKTPTNFQGCCTILLVINR